MIETARDRGTQFLLDRTAIEDCLARYGHAVDRCDADLLRSVYWPDGVDDRGFWTGGREDFVEFCRPIWARRDQTSHAISNILIRIEGDEARTQCYFHAYERVRNRSAPPNDVTIIGRYLDRFQKRDGEWRILRRRCVIDSWRVWPDSADWARGVFGAQVDVGRKDETDTAYAHFGDRLQAQIFDRPAGTGRHGRIR